MFRLTAGVASFKRYARFMKSITAVMFLRTRFIGRKWLYFARYHRHPVRIDPSTSISRRAVIRVTGGGSITIGKNCEIHDFAMIMTYGGRIDIGDNCSLNPFSIIYGHGGVRIGKDVRIAAHTVIIPANHNVTADSEPIRLTGLSARGIEIDDNVWLGAGVRVLDGVYIGKNSVVAAGCVVTKSVSENVTVAGIPARVIVKKAGA